MEWYTQNFNFVPSDMLYIEDGGAKRDVAIFAHIDQGLHARRPAVRVLMSWQPPTIFLGIAS